MGVSSSGQEICLWESTAILLCSVCLDTNHPAKDEGNGIMPDILSLEMVSTSAQYCSKTKDVKSCSYCCYVICTTLMEYGGMPWSKTSTTHHNAIYSQDFLKKCLVMSAVEKLVPLNLLNSLTLCCFQQSLEIGSYPYIPI